MRVVVTFLLNAGLNFAVGLAVATLLGPAAYGRYAILASTGALLATMLFEWLRLSTARFFGAAQQRTTPGLSASLIAAYATVTASLVFGGFVALSLPAHLGLTAAIVGAVVVTAVSNGLFDFRTATSRALFEDHDYAILVIGKGALGLIIASVAAFLSHDPVVVLVAQTAATLLIAVSIRRPMSLRGSATKPDLSLIRRFAAYGLPVVAANVVFQAILLLNRSVAASRFGFAAGGHLSLATDLELRMFLAVGAALDVLLFQKAVRLEQDGGRDAAAHQVRSNMVDVAAILTLMVVGFATTLPAFTTLVVPVRFQDGFMPLALAVLPGIALFCFGQFAINPVFQMDRRTWPLIAGALISAALDGVGLLLLPPSIGPVGIAALHSLSLATGVLGLAAVAFRNPAMRPAARDVAGIAVAALIAVLALWPLRSVPMPLVTLGLSALIGPAVYVMSLLAFDVGNTRRIARQLRPYGRAGHLEEAT